MLKTVLIKEKVRPYSPSKIVLAVVADTEHFGVLSFLVPAELET